MSSLPTSATLIHPLFAEAVQALLPLDPDCCALVLAYYCGNEVQCLAGSSAVGYRDGRLHDSRFHSLSALCAVAGPDPGTEPILLAADRDNQRIRMIDLAEGTVSTVAGSGPVGFEKGGYVDGPAMEARLRWPCSLLALPPSTPGEAEEEEREGKDDGVLSRYRVLLADHTRRLRQLWRGEVTTVAGDGGVGRVDSEDALTARLSTPCGLAYDANGKRVFFADRSQHCVRTYDLATGAVRTVCGEPGVRGCGDTDGKGAATAKLNEPCSLALHPPSSSLFVADYWNQRIRRVDLQLSADGTFPVSSYLALPVRPTSVCCDAVGTIFVGDEEDRIIRILPPECRAAEVPSAELLPLRGQPCLVDATGSLYAIHAKNSIVRLYAAGAPALARNIALNARQAVAAAAALLPESKAAAAVLASPGLLSVTEAYGNPVELRRTLQPNARKRRRHAGGAPAVAHASKRQKKER